MALKIPGTVCVLAGLFIFSAPLRADEPVDFLELEDLKFAIVKALRDSAAQFQSVEPRFLVTSITLDVKGVESQSGSGGLKIPVFSASASAEVVAAYTNSHQLEIVLSPNEPIATRAVPNIQLATMVSAVKKAFHGEDDPASPVTEMEADGATGTDVDLDGLTLNPDRVKYKYSGIMKQKVTGGLNFYFFKIGGELEEQSLQVITFELCRTENSVNCVE